MSIGHIHVAATPLYTFSGLLVFVAVVALTNAWYTVAGLLLTIAGAGGLGVFWERWSRMAGDDVHISAFLSPAQPTTGQWQLLTTHAPMLAIGATLLMWVAWRNSHPKGQGMS